MVMTRLDIINEARDYAGRLAEKVELNRQYDWVLRDITRKYPLIRNQQKTGTLVEDQNYILLPPNYAFFELFKVDGNEVDYIEPEDWREEYDEDDSSGSPSICTVIRPDNKLYMHNPPGDTYDYILYYACTHPKAGRSRAYTSGGTYVMKPGVTVTGATGGATGDVAFVSLTSGTFAGGDAAGTLIFSSQIGTFQSENLNVGANLNVATIGGNSSIENDFEHLLGEDFDKVIILGVASEACLKTRPVQMERHLELKGFYNEELAFWGNAYNQRLAGTTYRDF